MSLRRRAMVPPECLPLRGPVEADEFDVGGIEEGRNAGPKAVQTLLGLGANRPSTA